MRTYTIYVLNGLDADIRVRVKANKNATTSGALSVGEFEVKLGDAEGRTISPILTGWLPYVYLELWALSSPASGEVNAWLVKSKDKQVPLVSGLEIRDISSHDPDTDPGKIYIVEW